MPDTFEQLAPAMHQYKQFKVQQPDFVLLFKVGEFYEFYFEDAHLARRVLGIDTKLETIPDTGGQITPVARVPTQAIEHHLRRMIAAGHKCALCEPVNKSSRDITRSMRPESKGAKS